VGIKIQTQSVLETMSEFVHEYVKVLAEKMHRDQYLKPESEWKKAPGWNLHKKIESDFSSDDSSFDPKLAHDEEDIGSQDSSIEVGFNSEIDYCVTEEEVKHLT
jgi:hypothetical protein